MLSPVGIYNHFDYYKNAGTRGIKINLPDSVFYNHAIDYSIQKGVRFIITEYQRNFVIFPVERISYYLSILGKYRLKKSGSGRPSKNDIEEIKSLLPDIGYSLFPGNTKKDTIIKIAIDLANQKLQGTDYDYLLRYLEDSSYKVRKLSNTNNLNVICELRSKSSQMQRDLSLFLSAIN